MHPSSCQARLADVQAREHRATEQQRDTPAEADSLQEGRIAIQPRKGSTARAIELICRVLFDIPYVICVRELTK